MGTPLELFERIVRQTQRPTAPPPTPEEPTSDTEHPFEVRNVHPGLPAKVRKLFDDGHGAEATFHAFKYVEKVVQRHANTVKNGETLMMSSFSEDKPQVKLNALANPSEVDEQRGYKFMFAGAIVAIRNPGGHEIALSDDPDVCLDHLAFASLLLRRLERSGYK